jgi:hypothetical protein
MEGRRESSQQGELTESRELFQLTARAQLFSSCLFGGGGSGISPTTASPEASTKLRAHRIKSTASAIRASREQ